jgi:glycerophosphoryl diester phosphodiesterase
MTQISQSRGAASGGRDSSTPFLSFSGVLPIAHRAGMHEFGENSSSGIQKIADLGFCLETDVSVTPDGVPVLWHPRGLARVRTRRSLKHPRRAPGSSMASNHGALSPLEDVLAHYPTLRLLIDVKQWPAVEPVANAVARADAVRRVSIGTFSDNRNSATAKAILDRTGERVCTALGPLALMRFVLAAVAGHAEGHLSRGEIIQVPHRVVSRRLVTAAHAATLKVFAWTVNDPSSMRQLVYAGVDGIMTDYPTRLHAVLSTMQPGVGTGSMSAPPT